MRRKKNIKLRVRNLIERCNTKDPLKLCRKLKIDVKYADLGEVKGYFKKVLRNKYIVINENLDEYSQKVVLCHELGHAIMHSSKRILLMKENFYRYTPELENEANEFASELMSYHEEVDYEVLKKCYLGVELLEKLKNKRY